MGTHLRPQITAFSIFLIRISHALPTYIQQEFPFAFWINPRLPGICHESPFVFLSHCPLIQDHNSDSHWVSPVHTWSALPSSLVSSAPGSHPDPFSVPLLSSSNPLLSSSKTLLSQPSAHTISSQGPLFHAQFVIPVVKYSAKNKGSFQGC